MQRLRGVARLAGRGQRAGLATLGVVLEASPQVALVDEPLSIRVGGLAPQQPLTLLASLQERQVRLVACGQYRADSSGQLDLARDHSTGGTYLGCEPMGLFWSMRPPPAEKQNVRLSKRNVLEPFEVTIGAVAGHLDLAALCAEDGGGAGELLAGQTVQRWYKSQDVQRLVVREEGLRGILFLPPGEGPFLGVIDIFGSAGGLAEHRAALLASRGFAALALAYFAYEDLPAALWELDFDYMLKAVDWLSSHPRVKPTGIGVVGVSKGGDLAQCMAIYHPKVRAFVNINAPPNITVTHLMRNGRLLHRGSKHHVFRVVIGDDGTMNFKKAFDWNAETRIEPWKSEARALFICGEDDQLVDPEAQKKVVDLWPAERRDRLTFVSYPGAGHLIEPPYTPHCYASFHRTLGRDLVWGGNPADHARAQEDSWRRILQFLATSLGSSNL